MPLLYRIFIIFIFLPTVLWAQSSGNLVNLGTQVTDTHLEGSLFLKDETGKEWLYTVVRGTPGYLLGYDLTDNSLAVHLPLIAMDGAWDIAMSSDGWLYIAGSAGGRLAKHKPGTQLITDLGKPLASETYLFALAPGKNGEIFGATYPNCRVFRYHPNDGFTDVGNGPIKTGENYVHALAYYEPTDMLYAGIGSHTYIVKLNPRTGTKTEILPAKYQGSAGHIYDMKIISGLTGGDRLFANSNDLAKTFVYNLQTEVFEQEILRSVSVKSIVKSPVNQKIYYSAGWDNMYSYDMAQACPKPVLVGVTKKILASKWDNNNELLAINSDAKLIKYNVATNTKVVNDIEVPAQPIGLIAVHTGPNNKIWTGGYLVGNNAAYDPVTNAVTQYPGLNQPEGITVKGDSIYFGTYTRAEFYVYNTLQPWNIAAGNPKKIGQAAGQDRPFGGVAVSEHGKMFFGTVPGYGVLGGALVEYEISQNKMTSHANVVQDLSIVSLAYANGNVLGGTSVWGGLGIEPTVNGAKLFGWNPVTKSKTFEITPVANAKAITELINGPDGNVWGAADGVLFIFNPISQTVIYQGEIYPVSAETKAKAVWRDARLLIHPSGDIYGTGGGKFFKINPTTKAVTIIPVGIAVYDLAIDNLGRLYFRNGKNLWQYTI